MNNHRFPMSLTLSVSPLHRFSLLTKLVEPPMRHRNRDKRFSTKFISISLDLCVSHEWFQMKRTFAMEILSEFEWIELCWHALNWTEIESRWTEIKSNRIELNRTELNPIKLKIYWNFPSYLQESLRFFHSTLQKKRKVHVLFVERIMFKTVKLIALFAMHQKRALTRTHRLQTQQTDGDKWLEWIYWCFKWLSFV